MSGNCEIKLWLVPGVLLLTHKLPSVINGGSFMTYCKGIDCRIEDFIINERQILTKLYFVGIES